MLLTGRFLSARVSSVEQKTICVMRFVRDHYRYDLWLWDLAPSIELLNDDGNKKISWKEYEQSYLKEIMKKRSRS